MQELRTDRRREFIFAKLKKFCDRSEIKIKYAISYIHKKNGIRKRGWQTIVMIKDFLLINSSLPLEFWAAAINTTCYLQNRLPTKYQRGKLIPKKCWTEKKQDISHIKVFTSTVSIVILKEKRQKSNIYKNWKGIFIKYSQDTTKHIQAWASKTQQILIVSNSYIGKSKQRAKLLTNYLLDLSHQPSILKRKTPIKEPRLRGQSQKVIAALVETGPIPSIADPAEPAGDELSHTDFEERNMSVTEISSKIYELKTYKEAISNPIHSREWKKAIKEEIQNLKDHQTWEFDYLPLGRKVVRSK